MRINSSVTLATFKNHLRKVDFENLLRTDSFTLHSSINLSSYKAHNYSKIQFRRL